MIKFIDNIIYYSIADISDFSETSQEASSANLDKADEEFALKLYKNSNTITSKTQIHFSAHNATYFKYKAAIPGKCQFDFPCPCVVKTNVTELSIIKLSQNNL